jgi:uncharacterized membrane protein
MSYAWMVAAATAALVLCLAATGCEAPYTDAASPKQIPGVTFLGDKAHPAKILQLSADGHAAVGFLFDGDKEPQRYAHSFYWTEAGGLKIIRTKDGQDVEVRAISADGTTAAGGYYDRTSAHVFRWTEAGGIEDLGTPDDPPGFIGVEGGGGAMARTVSANGGVIFGTLPSRNSFDDFRWTRATGVQRLHIPGDIRAATPDGSIVVGLLFIEPTTHIFRWGLDRGFEDLGVPPGASSGDGYLTAKAVSADGSTIVGEYGTKTDGTRGYRWTQSGGFRVLSHDNASAALDVSGDGSQIVGMAFSPKVNTSLAVRWLGDQPPQPVGPPGLRASVAGNISADGRTIAGMALVRTGDERTFLLRLK